MAQSAKKHPDVYFEQATGTIQTKNMAEYFGAGEDANYLAGIAAGAATKKNLIGLVVAFPIPEVIRHTNAFALGTQAANPNAKVKIVWTNTWFDPAKEKKAAESLVGAGADVLAQNVDSPATGQYAQSKKLPWVGYDSDARKFAPTSWLTAPVYNWGPYYLSRVKAAMDGSWKTGFYYGNLKDGFVRLAPFGPGVTTKTKAVIAAKLKALKDGSFYEFTGPLYDQSGKLRVPKGKRLTVKDLYAINWLVKGVIGSPKG
jgi:basic membrane protein A